MVLSYTQFFLNCNIMHIDIYEIISMNSDRKLYRYLTKSEDLQNTSKTHKTFLGIEPNSNMAFPTE